MSATTDTGPPLDTGPGPDIRPGPDPGTGPGPDARVSQGEPRAVRLALKAGDGSRGLLDGAWWPYSRDLAAELPALVDVLDPLWGRVTRIAVNPRYWPVVPRKVPVRGHVVKVGWFKAEQDPHKLLLLSNTVGRWDLLVIPPDTPADSAARLMAAASDPAGPPLTASALMAGETDRFGAATGDEAVTPPTPGEAGGEAPSAGVAVPASRLIMGM
ncbi:DUF5994 family protein [Streptomyces sp. NPDC007172]|uniref:DUF5994 family protein n=1 Tax=Streptomyces sp. NPDC007172 TaxID=3364776 RepID=UPI003682CC6A